jgi:hypothetical protein
MGRARRVPRRVVVLLATCVAIGIPGNVLGSEGNAYTPVGGCTNTIEGDTVTVECAEPAPKPPPRPNGVTGPVEACRWVAATAADGWDPADYGDITASGYVFGASADGGVVRTFPDGRTEQVFARECPDGVGGFTWVDTSITIDDVIDDAVDRATRTVPAPTLDLSPSPEAGGIVNLGLWLALAGQDPVTARAEAGSLWAEATVTLASTTWDMGNGDTVTCDGAGTPIADTDTLDEGPCGYTYRQSSPDDAPFTLTVTATWAVSYQSSAGVGSAGTVDRTSSVAYDVDEVQTIGVSN